MQYKPVTNREPNTPAISDLKPRIYAGIIFACAAIGVGMLVIGLSDPFLAPHDFDEGVYWQTLRSMSAGYHLYGQIFYSQPPFFLLSIYPFHASLGSTLEAAHVGVAVFSLLGFAGAYMMGRALGGRAGGAAALAILAVSPAYLAQSQKLQAEGPATAFLLLAVGAALLWREHPTGRSGYCLAIFSGVALSLGVLTKLFDAVALVPMLLIVVVRLREARRAPTANGRADLPPIAAAILAGVVTALVVLAPFAHWPDQVMRQTVTLHLDAWAAMNVPADQNIDTLRRFFATNALVSAAAFVGVFVAILRRDWRIVPLAAWLLATLAFLAVHYPLLLRHTIILVPPLIAIVALALNDLPTISFRAPRPLRQKLVLLAAGLAAATVLFSIALDYRYYRKLAAAAESSAQHVIKLAAELKRTTTADQWVITDDPFVAGLAGRDVPPWLVDTALVRVQAGYLSIRELLEAGADPRVHAVLFATGRLTAAPVASFHDWVAEHFQRVDLRDVGAGVELWVR